MSFDLVVWLSCMCCFSGSKHFFLILRIKVPVYREQNWTKMQDSTDFLNSPMQAALSGPPDTPVLPAPSFMQSGLQMSLGSTVHPGFQYYPSPSGVPCLPWLPSLSTILIALQHSDGSGRNTTCQQGAVSAQKAIEKV